MTILQMFVNFVSIILDFRILNISIYEYLIAFTILIFVFKLIGVLGNSKINSHKQKEDKKGKDKE